MRWRVVGPVLGVVLLGAVVFSLWPSGPVELPRDEPAPSPGVAPKTPTLAPLRRDDAPAQPAAANAPRAAAPAAAPAPAAPPEPGFPGKLDDDVDPVQLAALGLTLEDREPEDAGVPIHPVTSDGIRAAVKAALPEIKECYDGWLQQNPDLGGRVKIKFRIAEIPGRDRAKVMDVDTADDAGVGNIAFEGCVKNVFKTLRFERPEDGEMSVTYPLVFSNDKAPKKAP